MASVLDVRGVTKAFGGTVALRRVDFEVRRGEIHALLGENGAGKSTLVRIMSGVIQPDEGNLLSEGTQLGLRSAREALDNGISVVHQELALIPNLTVAENVLLSHRGKRAGGAGGRLGIVSKRASRRDARVFLDRLGVKVDPNVRVERLGQSERQAVEIARALAQSARVLLLDEPTSALPPAERVDLFARVRELRARGLGVVLVTHDLEDALKVADRITVLRDGVKVCTADAADLTVENLIEYMTGRPAGSVFPAHGRAASEGMPRLAVENLSSPPQVSDISFDIFPGEIVGLAGLVGSGRTECLKAIFGVRSKSGGRVYVDGRVSEFGSARAAVNSGLVLVPEDRQGEGLFPDHSVVRNIATAAATSRRGSRVTRFRYLLSDRAMRELGLELMRDLQIRGGGLTTPVAALSGGNQQKVVLARCLALKPKLILADDPTRGVSVGSKIEIYKTLRRLSMGGTSVLLVSSEFEELAGLCDRVVVLRAGESVGEALTDGLNGEQLLNLVLSYSAQRDKVATS